MGKEKAFDELDALSRLRPLTKLEVIRLERSVRQSLGPKGQKPWLLGDVRRLHDYLLRGKRPRHICILMGRTERAIWTKMWRLGWVVREADRQRIVLPEWLSCED